ncbi:ARHGEF12 [Mytilus edulis]|uniref:ARHGEF12 n=1 Tax=Mytilus edulis TaxID=6550 RepID=A0A8S3RGK5_MYTED|nr:ARHGEF12 [Mytilus edulis]
MQSKQKLRRKSSLFGEKTKAGSFVALTLLNKPATGGEQYKLVINHQEDRKSKELALSKLSELKRYYDLALEDLQQIKKEYNRNPSAKLGSQIVDKEKTVKKLEEQLKVQHSDSAPELGQLDPQPVSSWPTTILDGGNTSESPTISPSSSPTPIHARNLTIQSEDNDSVSSGTTKDSGYDECTQAGSLGGSGKAQQDIIAMEDDEFSDEEPSGTVNNGAFSSLKLLESRPPHLAVFLNYVMTQSEDPSSLLFYIVSGYYRTTPGTCKELKKWAFEIYSTFLVAAGSPLKLNVDESISVEIDNVLVYRNDKEDILRRVFDHARASVQTELQNMLHEFCSKKEIGFGNMYGIHELKDIMKKNEEIAVVEKYVMPHLDRCFKGDGGEDTIKSERELAMGWALNTFLRNVGVNRHNSSMDRVQSFIDKDKRLLKIGQQKKKKVSTVQQHQFQLQHYYKVEKCIHCDKVIWGVGYQAYQCQTCDLSVHKACIDELDEPCRKQRGKSKFRNFRQHLLQNTLPSPPKTDINTSSVRKTIQLALAQHSVNRLVQNFEDLQGDKRRSPGLEPTEPQKKGSDLGRSESMKSRGDSKGDRPARRAKR